MRDNRPKNSELPEDQRKRQYARNYLNTYIRRGKIMRRPCQECGNPVAQAHHDDYDKPLQVIWLCRTHHLELHTKLRV